MTLTTKQAQDLKFITAYVYVPPENQKSSRVISLMEMCINPGTILKKKWGCIGGGEIHGKSKIDHSAPQGWVDYY